MWMIEKENLVVVHLPSQLQLSDLLSYVSQSLQDDELAALLLVALVVLLTVRLFSFSLLLPDLLSVDGVAMS